MRIFLIGFMGSGKSYTGKKLAHLLDYPFVDLDDWIEKEAGKTITKIFAEEGEEVFRKTEKKALHDMNQFKNVVVATGGGVPCFFDNINWMNQQGLTIFLDTPVEILISRLIAEKDHRPLLKQLPDREALKSYIEQKLEARSPYYQQAWVIFQQQSLQENVAEQLTKQLSNIIGH